MVAPLWFLGSPNLVVAGLVEEGFLHAQVNVSEFMKESSELSIMVAVGFPASDLHGGMNLGVEGAGRLCKSL